MSENKRMPRNVVFLGITSFFTDMATEMIYPFIPIFLFSVLGVSRTFIGLIEGIAELTSSLLKIVSGWFSDLLNRRKPLTVLGYSISSLAKPMLALAATGWFVLIMRFFDRLGKGIRTAPRDALIAGSTDKSKFGRSFGFHRALDTMGAVAGPLLAFLVLPMIKGNYRTLFLISLIPGILAVAILVFFVKEKKEAAVQNRDIKLPSLRGLDKKLYLFLAVIFIFSLGNSTDAFLILRAQNLGIPIMFIPLLWLSFNLTYAVSAIPSGIVSDRIGRTKVLSLGFLIYSITYFGFAVSKTPAAIWFLFMFYGLYYGLTDGVFRAYVADVVPQNVRGSAFGIFHATVGVSLFFASILMGVLWDTLGVTFAFSFGAVLSIIAALFILFLK